MKKSFWNLFCDIDNQNNKYFDACDYVDDTEMQWLNEPLKDPMKVQKKYAHQCNLCLEKDCATMQIAEIIFIIFGLPKEDEKIEIDFNKLSARKIENGILITECMHNGILYDYFNAPSEVQMDTEGVEKFQKAMTLILTWFMGDFNGTKALNDHRIFIRK